MNYIEFAENERLSTIVLGMMRISELSEDEVEGLVEGALSIGINTFDLADIYGQALVGMVSTTAQWWLDERNPGKEVVATHIVNLCWNGLSGMELKPKLGGK